MSRAPDQTKSTIDRIGEKLKSGDFSLAVLEGLDTFRSSHDRIIPMVLHAVARRGTLTLRAAKSTASIVAKLRRESVRLSQIQDIAGCRIIVSDLVTQAEMLEDGFDFIGAATEYRNLDASLGYRFDARPSIDIPFRATDGSSNNPEPRLSKPRFEPVGDDLKFTVKEIDRLSKPQFGYRAVHIVVAYRSRMMEVQVRTQLQHAWAELSEKAADKYGHGLKYGHGDAAALEKLERLSREIAAFEDYEEEHYGDDDAAVELGIMRKEILETIRSEAFSL